MALTTNPPAASLELADDTRCQQALRAAPPGFEPASASAVEPGHPDIARAAELRASIRS